MQRTIAKSGFATKQNHASWIELSEIIKWYAPILSQEKCCNSKGVLTPLEIASDDSQKGHQFDTNVKIQ